MRPHEPPSEWLVDNADLLPRGGRALDLACGRGRNALWLARAGFDVTAIDRNADTIAQLQDIAGRSGVRIVTGVVDFETDPPPSLGSQTYDVVLAFNYLHRPLMPAIREAVKVGGRLFYETFTRRQAERGRPTNPAFLLEDGELARLVSPFAILRSREGDIDGRCIASVVAGRDA